jgi:thiamine pyrophosphate-dependent acetolactate synthase large subunit-like protein
VDTVGERLRAISGELASAFGDVPTPPAFAWALDPRPRLHTAERRGHDLGDPEGRLAILAGPHALEFRDALHRVAEHLSAPVANTWGAKGIFPWDSPHHMGTCGLQSDDFALLGFADYGVILATGIDPAESPEHRFALAPVVHVLPKTLGHLAEDVPPRSHPIEPNALYDRIASVAQAGYVDDRVPRHPARAVMDLKRSMAPGAVLTAQPGPVGLWVARTFPTDGPGTVFVPAVDAPGIAAALALLAAAAGRDAVAVTEAPIDPVTEMAVEVAARAGTPFRLEVWADDVDLGLTSLLVDAAGPVVAWKT